MQLLDETTPLATLHIARHLMAAQTLTAEAGAKFNDTKGMQG